MACSLGWLRTSWSCGSSNTRKAKDHMKLKFSLMIIIIGCCGLAQLGNAQCAQNCNGIDNTGLGTDALLHNTGQNNTALGSLALDANTTGFGNTATGAFSLVSNTTASNNTAIGVSSLESN